MEEQKKIHTVVFGMFAILAAFTSGCVSETSLDSQEDELRAPGDPPGGSNELSDWGDDDIVVVYPGDAGTDSEDGDAGGEGSTPRFTGSFENDYPVIDGLELHRPCECNFEVSENNGLICMRMVCSETCSERVRQCASLFGGCTLQRF